MISKFTDSRSVAAITFFNAFAHMRAHTRRRLCVAQPTILFHMGRVFRNLRGSIYDSDNWQDDRWIRCRDLIEITASIRSFFFFCPSSRSSASPPGFCPFAFRGSLSKSDHGCSLLIVAMAWQWAYTRSSVPLVYYNYSHSIMQYTAIRNPGQDLKRKYTNRSCNYTLAVA